MKSYDIMLPSALKTYLIIIYVNTEYSTKLEENIIL